MSVVAIEKNILGGVFVERREKIKGILSNHLSKTEWELINISAMLKLINSTENGITRATLLRIMYELQERGFIECRVSPFNNKSKEYKLL